MVAKIIRVFSVALATELIERQTILSTMKINKLHLQIITEA